MNLLDLPEEIIYYIFDKMPLNNVFDLYSISNTSLNKILDNYLESYMIKEKYKTSLTDAMILINYENFYVQILEFFSEFFSNLVTTFISLVEQVGGPINYSNLILEENPRDIYTIKVIMEKNTHIFEYIISSASIFPGNMYVYSFGRKHYPKMNKSINDVYKIYNILTKLFELINMDGRKFKSITLNKENLNRPSEVINIIKYT
jgi:hypothetical protein